MPACGNKFVSGSSRKATVAVSIFVWYGNGAFMAYNGWGIYSLMGGAFKAYNGWGIHDLRVWLWGRTSMPCI